MRTVFCVLLAGGLLGSFGCKSGGTARDAALDAGPDARVDAATSADASPSDAGLQADAAVGPLEVAQFTDVARTKAHLGACLPDQMPLLGFAPVTTGVRYPLFVWTVGTGAQHDSAEVVVILSEMAKRGFVAVSPSYDTFIVNGCANLREKTMCIYDPAQPESLVTKMCARPDADCAQGIVVGGHSQGAGLAVMAKNYDDRVEAAYVIGGTCDYLLDQIDGLCNPDGAATDTDCAHHTQTALPSERLRIINGEADEYGVQLEYERVTGRQCAPGTMDCLAADGSGWYLIPNSAVEDGLADHCYIINSTDGAWCPGVDAAHPFDVGWVPPAAHTWSLLPNLAWLAAFVGR